MCIDQNGVRNMTRNRALLACIAVLTTGCASLVAPAYSPDYPTLDRLKTGQLEKVTVGTFQPQDPQAPVNKITLRGASLATSQGTFAQYLESAMRSDLNELRLLDPNAQTRVDATLLKNDIDISGFSIGTGVISVALTVSKRGARVLEKTYTTNTEFESSFAGAVAIPKGMNEYPTLVRMLLRTIYSDPAFINAIKP
jgi:hypothetical protein